MENLSNTEKLKNLQRIVQLENREQQLWEKEKSDEGLSGKEAMELREIGRELLMIEEEKYKELRRNRNLWMLHGFAIAVSIMALVTSILTSFYLPQIQ